MPLVKKFLEKESFTFKPEKADHECSAKNDLMRIKVRTLVAKTLDGSEFIYCIDFCFKEGDKLAFFDTFKKVKEEIAIHNVTYIL